MRKNLYVMCGCPASGKSTWVKNRIATKGGISISRDDIRRTFLKNGDGYFSHEKQVFAQFCNQIQSAIDNPRGEIDIYADATHLNEASRRKLLSNLNLVNVSHVYVVYMEVSLETAMDRNDARPEESRVPDDAIERMYDSIQEPSNGGVFNYEVIKVGDSHENMDNV